MGGAQFSNSSAAFLALLEICFAEKIGMPKEAKEKLIGEIAHYYGNIGVAVVDLKSTLKAGETIHIIGGDTDFEQAVESMQIEHEQIKTAKKGQSVGLKVKEKVREGYKVYKVQG